MKATIAITVPDDILGLDNGDFESLISTRAFGADLAESGHYIEYRITRATGEFTVDLEVTATPDR